METRTLITTLPTCVDGTDLRQGGSREREEGTMLRRKEEKLRIEWRNGRYGEEKLEVREEGK